MEIDVQAMFAPFIKFVWMAVGIAIAFVALYSAIVVIAKRKAREKDRDRLEELRELDRLL